MRRLLTTGIITLIVIVTAATYSPPVNTNLEVADLTMVQDVLIPSSKVVFVEQIEAPMNKDTFDTMNVIMDYIAENNKMWSYDDRYGIAREIMTESFKNDLDPLLVAGTIKVESHFNNSSVSSAEARGMMQLIPSTARSTARALNKSSYDLTDYRDNIELGCFYLAQSINAYEKGTVSRSHPRTGVPLSDTEMGVLAYNGGVKTATSLRNISYLDLVAKEYNILKTKLKEL